MGINITRRSSICFAYLVELVNWLTPKEMVVQQREIFPIPVTYAGVFVKADGAQCLRQV